MRNQDPSGPERPVPTSARRDDATAEYELIALRSHRRFPPDRLSSPVTDSDPLCETATAA